MLKTLSPPSLPLLCNKPPALLQPLSMSWMTSMFGAPLTRSRATAATTPLTGLYLNARNKHEVIRWAGLIDLILSDASKEAVLAHAGRCMMGVKLADEHNNYALTGVLTDITLSLMCPSTTPS